MLITQQHADHTHHIVIPPTRQALHSDHPVLLDGWTVGPQGQLTGEAAEHRVTRDGQVLLWVGVGEGGP
jgi:hypothetical protein